MKYLLSLSARMRSKAEKAKCHSLALLSHVWSKAEKTKLAALALLSLFGVSMLAHAGADVTFDSVNTNLTAWIEGSLGKAIAIGALGTGLAAAIVKQSLMFLAVAVGIGLSAYYGPGVISGIVSATL